eukprot:4924453-Ditylum_brightwellii.AAC.1
MATGTPTCPALHRLAHTNIATYCIGDTLATPNAHFYAALNHSARAMGLQLHNTNSTTTTDNDYPLLSLPHNTQNRHYDNTILQLSCTAFLNQTHTISTHTQINAHTSLAANFIDAA